LSSPARCPPSLKIIFCVFARLIANLSILFQLNSGYQIARLRIARGLTQAQLAEMVGAHQPSIARIESGKSLPSLLFLERVASVLHARIEVRILPM